MKRDMLEVVDARPPNYDAIAAVLPRAAEPGVMFAYDGKVYFPGGRGPLTRELDAHERVHIERQAGDVAGWWKQYLEDVNFRFYEELLAHKAEYETYCRRHANPVKRAQALQRITKRLISPLYGEVIAHTYGAVAEAIYGRLSTDVFHPNFPRNVAEEIREGVAR